MVYNKEKVNSLAQSQEINKQKNTLSLFTVGKLSNSVKMPSIQSTRQLKNNLWFFKKYYLYQSFYLN